MKTLQVLAAVLGSLGAACCMAASGFAPGSCQQHKAEVCLDATPCKRIGEARVCLSNQAVAPPAGAIVVAATCWQYEAGYTCREASAQDTCGPLRGRGCGQVATQCLTTDAQGACLSATQTYACPAPANVVREVNVCTPSVCQADGTGCFDTSYNPDRDFGIAAAAMEAGREAGVYGSNGAGLNIFKGYMEECSVKTLGGEIKSCCTAAGGGAAFRNHEVVGLTAEAAYAVGNESLKAGSKYLYDSLFQTVDASLVVDGAVVAGQSLTESATANVAASSGTSFGAYGFTFQYSASGGFSFVGFDPTTFAIAVAIQIITAWLACDQTDQIVQMKVGQNLCVHIDSYCSAAALGVCVTRRQRHCCFNSVLAKILNRQGRAQLGLPMDQCGGFNEEQIARIDFSRIDFAEFIASINAAVVAPNAGAAENRVSATVQEKVRNYYDQGP